MFGFGKKKDKAKVNNNITDAFIVEANPALAKMFNKILFLFLIIFYNVTNASIDEAIQNKAIEITIIHLLLIIKKFEFI